VKFTAEEIQNLAAEFEDQAPREILQWAADNFGPRVAISSAFGPEGLVVIDIAMRKVTPRLPVFTIDTGFFFKETVELIHKVEQEYGIIIERLHPELTPEQQAAGPIASQSRGGYAEVGYDILRVLEPSSDHAVNLFTRFDYADTQAVVPDGLARRLEFRRYSQMVGVVYKPIPQVALKMDYRRHWLGNDEAFNEFASAITWLF